jgi:hypothetical protein
MLIVFKLDDDIWKHAKKIIKGKEISAQCNKCPKIIKMSGGSRTTLLKHLYKKLQGRADEISELLLENLRERITARINETVMNLLRCLKDPNINPKTTDLRFAKELLQRLFHHEPVAEQEGVAENEPPLTLEDELNRLIDEAHDEPQPENDFKSLKAEFTAFARTGTRTDNLQKLYNALLTIKPTSTDVERVFSSTNWYCSKIRSRLSDKSLSALVFLKFYYKTHNTNV